MKETATIGVAMMIKSVGIIISTRGTEIVPTRNTAVTSITTIKDTVTNTGAIGDPGRNGTGSKKSIRIFTGMEITTAKTPI